MRRRTRAAVVGATEASALTLGGHGTMSQLFNPKAEKKLLTDAGTFTGGGHKFIVHTTEGSSLDGAFSTRSQNEDAAHFILEVKDGHQRLVQCIPINRAARSLEHPSGTLETNRANCIQVEVVGFTDENLSKQLGHHELFVGNWSPQIYKAIHDLMFWTHQNFGVPMESDHPFPGHPGFARLSQQAFVDAVGLLGHCHAASNSHTDPGPLNARLVVKGPHAVPVGAHSS